MYSIQSSKLASLYWPFQKLSTHHCSWISRSSQSPVPSSREMLTLWHMALFHSLVYGEPAPSSLLVVVLPSTHFLQASLQLNLVDKINVSVSKGWSHFALCCLQIPFSRASQPALTRLICFQGKFNRRAGSRPTTFVLLASSQHLNHYLEITKGSWVL